MKVQLQGGFLTYDSYQIGHSDSDANVHNIIQSQGAEQSCGSSQTTLIQTHLPTYNE